MKKFIFLGLALLVVIGFIFNQMKTQNYKKVEVGDDVPSFVLKDQNNNDFSLDQFISKKAMVIYFYPKDDTPGCTKEACAFRDAYESFIDLHVEVIGISGDDVASHKKFADKFQLPFTLLADVKNEVRKLFGAPKSMLGLVPGRVTYVIGKNGKVIYIFNSQFNAEAHISKSLSILKNER